MCAISAALSCLESERLSLVEHAVIDDCGRLVVVEMTVGRADGEAAVIDPATALATGRTGRGFGAGAGRGDFPDNGITSPEP